jgi:hypothetical protein
LFVDSAARPASRKAEPYRPPRVILGIKKGIDFMSGIFIIAAIYFTPTLLVLCNQGAPWGNKIFVFGVNLFFGWTFVGLIIAAGLALVDYKSAARIAQAKNDFYLREDAKYRAGQNTVR